MSDHTASPVTGQMNEHVQSQIIADDAVSIASSNESTTSTVVFKHESFNTFHSKIIDLCKKNWPQLAPEAFQAYRMDGGSYNRVVNIQVDVAKKRRTWIQRQALDLMRKVCYNTDRKSRVQDYVVRIPRYERAWVEHEVAILLFLAGTKVPAPKIRSFSFTEENSIGSRFAIQRRLPGQPAVDVYLDLNTQQRVCFARDLGNALAEMGKLRSPCPGTLNPASILDGCFDGLLLRLQCPPRNAQRSPSGEALVYSTPQSVYEFIMTQCARQQEYDVSSQRFHSPWQRFIPIVNELNKMGIFDNNAYCLSHMDFEPRNMIIDITSPTTAALSGIIDWDEAVFAPVFANCRPPSWLWDFEGDEDLDETVAHQIPKDPNLQAIKKAFEEAAGPEYLKYAYSAEYRIARNICKLAITGWHSYEIDMKMAKEVVEAWNELKPECRVSVSFEVEDDE